MICSKLKPRQILPANQSAPYKYSKRMTSNEEKSDESECETKQLKLQKVHLQTPNDKYNQFFNVFHKYSAVSVSVAIVAVVVVIAMTLGECTKCFSSLEKLENIPHKAEDSLKKYWVHGKNVESGFLSNVFAVLDRLGYKNDPNATDWSLLWAHDYPFYTLYSELKNLKPYQKVNKLPGSGYITSKVELSTSRLKYIPRAFRLPKDKEKLLEYAKDNPSVQFVQKNNKHRHA